MSRRSPALLSAAVATTLPGLVLRVGGVAAPAVLRAVLYGAAVVGAALLLAWAAEVAQLDLSPAVAIAGLALVAVLPEYVVGNVFAWRGGHAVRHFGPTCQAPAAHLAGHDAPCTLALANMLGANRLLIGVGWSVVVLVAWHRRRQRGQHVRGVALGREHSVEVAFMAVACLWCLTLPFRRSLGLGDAAVLLAVFAGYAVRVAQAPAEEPELEGVAAWLGMQRPHVRRAAGLACAGLAVVVVFVCADAFADALVASGSVLGVDEFFLVQWLAPLASEAPELVVAFVYAWRLRAATGLGALVSSKVNQWTVLIASLPISFAVAARSLHGLPLGTIPREELALTAAQSIFGVGVIGNLDVSTIEAGTVFALFAGELIGITAAPASARGALRIGFSVAYIVLGSAILSVKRRDTAALVRDGFRTPYGELGGSA